MFYIFTTLKIKIFMFYMFWEIKAKNSRFAHWLINISSSLNFHHSKNNSDFVGNFHHTKFLLCITVNFVLLEYQYIKKILKCLALLTRLTNNSAQSLNWTIQLNPLILKLVDRKSVEHRSYGKIFCSVFDFLTEKRGKLRQHDIPSTDFPLLRLQD